MACNCPRCKKDDRVEKVTAIAAQRSVGVSSGWHSSLYSDGKSFGVASGPSIAVFNASSDLVNMCQEPEEPKLGFFGTLTAIGSIIKTYPPLIRFLLLVYDLFGFYILIKFIYFRGFNSNPVVFLFFIPLLGIFAYNTYLFFSVMLPEKRKQVFMAKLLWERLYYCYRDGIFFDTDGQVYSTTTIRQILGN